MANIDPNDTRILIDITKDINKKALDDPIDSRQTNHEAINDSKKLASSLRPLALHKSSSSWEIEIYVQITNIHILAKHYATFYVLNVDAHNPQLQN